MIWLIIGLALWWGAHFLKRLAPGARAGLEARFGAGGARGVVALGIGAGVVLMILGFRSSAFISVWTPPPWTIHINNLLMLLAVGLFGASHSKSRAKGWFRHPMLLAALTWAVAHLLVNGDLASLILFGGIGVWAVVEMALINARDGAWTRPAGGSLAGDIRLVLITLVAFGLIAGIHAWLGYWPFPG